MCENPKEALRVGLLNASPRSSHDVPRNSICEPCREHWLPTLNDVAVAEVHRVAKNQARGSSWINLEIKVLDLRALRTFVRTRTNDEASKQGTN